MMGQKVVVPMAVKQAVILVDQEAALMVGNLAAVLTVATPVVVMVVTAREGRNKLAGYDATDNTFSNTAKSNT